MISQKFPFIEKCVESRKYLSILVLLLKCILPDCSILSVERKENVSEN